MFESSTIGTIPTTHHIDDTIDSLLTKANSLTDVVKRDPAFKAKLDKTIFDIRNIKIGVCLEIPKNRSIIMENLEKHDLTLHMIETLSKRG